MLHTYQNHYNFFSTPAPPLTVDTVVRAVHGVRNWRRFGWLLFIWSGISNEASKLDTIEQQHNSDGNYLHGVVKEWFSGHQQSWRKVIYALDWAWERVVADSIRGYAEPPPGEWSDNCCVMGDLVIVSSPTPPISVQGLVSVAQMSFSEFERKQSLQFDAFIWSFHAAQIKTYTMFLHLLSVVQDSDLSKLTFILGGCGLVI